MGLRVAEKGKLSFIDNKRLIMFNYICFKYLIGSKKLRIANWNKTNGFK